MYLTVYNYCYHRKQKNTENVTLSIHQYDQTIYIYIYIYIYIIVSARTSICIITEKYTNYWIKSFTFINKAHTSKPDTPLGLGFETSIFQST